MQPFQNLACREYVRDPHPNQKKQQPIRRHYARMPYLQKFCSHQKFRKKNGQNLQGFKASMCQHHHHFCQAGWRFDRFVAFEANDHWESQFLLGPTEKRNDPIGRIGFHISLTKWKLPHFLESENPVSKIFGGSLKIYRKTIHVEMLTVIQPYPTSTFWTYAVLTDLARDLPFFVAVADRCSSRFLVASDVAWKARQKACVASIQGSHEDDSSWQFWAVTLDL